jgi:putative PIN family toxin of toxin-antitoxin system
LIKVVIDTNILVSALWTNDGKPAKVISLLQSGEIVPYYNAEILQEYIDVLFRPKFKFNRVDIEVLLLRIVRDGISVTAAPTEVHFTDKTDQKFYEVAVQCGAKLITGNLKHFPKDGIAVSAGDFIQNLEKREEIKP